MNIPINVPYVCSIVFTKKSKRMYCFEAIQSRRVEYMKDFTTIIAKSECEIEGKMKIMKNTWTVSFGYDNVSGRSKEIIKLKNDEPPIVRVIKSNLNITSKRYYCNIFMKMLDNMKICNGRKKERKGKKSKITFYLNGKFKIKSTLDKEFLEDSLKIVKLHEQMFKIEQESLFM